MRFTKIGILLFFLFASLAYGIKIEKKGEISLDQKKEIIQRGWLFSVNENEYLYLIDIKARNIKLYDIYGGLISIVKKNGFGPQEVALPMSIDYKKGVSAVGDAGKNRLIIYKKNGLDLDEFKELKGNNIGFDMRMNGNQLFISGLKTDSYGTMYGLFSIDIDTENVNYLIPLHRCYGFSSQPELMSKIIDHVNIIGRCCFGDVDDQEAFLCWQGDLRVLVADRQTRKVITFGNKTKNYKKPEVTKKMIDLNNSRSPLLKIEYRQFSYLTGLFVDKSFVAVLYGNYREEIPGWQTFIQFYTRNGQFIKEEELPGAINNDDYPMKSFFYSPDTDNLYFLKKTIDKELNDVYSLIKYRIGQ